MRFGRLLALAGACALAGCVVSGAQPPVQAGTGLTDSSGKMSVDGTTVPVLPSTCVTGDVVVKTADGWTCQPPPSPNIWQDGPGIQIANHAISFYAPTVPATDVWPGTMDYSHLTDAPVAPTWSSIASSVKATDAWPGTMPYSQLTDAPPVTWQTVASTVQRTDIWPGTLNYSQLNGAPAIPPAATWSIVKPSVQSTDAWPGTTTWDSMKASVQPTDAWPGTMDYSQLTNAPAGLTPTWSDIAPSVTPAIAWPGTVDYSHVKNAPAVTWPTIAVSVTSTAPWPGIVDYSHVTNAPAVTWATVAPSVTSTTAWPGIVDYSQLTNLPANLGQVASDVTTLKTDVTTLQGQMTTASSSISSLDAEVPSLAKAGANSDITSLSDLTTPLPVAEGGTGSSSLPAYAVILGNGTSPVRTVNPGTAGNVLLSNGTTWTSAPAPSGGAPKRPPSHGEELVWHLDETSAPAQNSGWAGSAPLSPTYLTTPLALFGAPGPFSNTVLFWGDGLSGGSNVNTSNGGRSLCVSAWYLPFESPSQEQIVIKAYRNDESWTAPFVGFAIARANLGLECSATIGNPGNGIESQAVAPYPLLDGVPSLLACTYDGTYLRGYVNGLQVLQTYVTGPLDYGYTPGPWTVGSSNSTVSGGYPAHGLIWDVRVSTTLRTPAQMVADYKTGMGYSY